MKNSLSKGDIRKIANVRVPRDYAWHVLGSLTEDLGCSLGSTYDHIKDVVRKRDFPSYLSLWETWKSQGIISDDTTTEMFLSLYQASSLLKKFQFPSDSKLRRTTAYDKFIAAELACANFNLDGYKALAWLENEEELAVYTYAKSFLSKLLGETLPAQKTLTFWSRHGPGSNLDTTRRAVSLYDKYKNWPYSCTDLALRHARSVISNDERWLGALEDSYRRRNNIPFERIIDQDAFWSSVFSVVPGNRICFVPKNSQTDRSIAIEPSMNLYLQLGVDGYIRRRLKRWGVDLDNQERNQILAREGSINWKDPESFVTLDLAAASDTISLSVCKLMLPPQWYNYLYELRSPSGECNGETISYEKISSMGNGYTFALESAIFTAIVYGVEKTLRGSFDKDKVAIYGDDIIVRKASSGLVIRMLEKCGFNTNLDKTHVSGPFRESCGADFFKGTPVRPVFLVSNPSTVMELWSDLNRVRRILSLRRGGFEFKVCHTLERWIPPQLITVAGPYSDEDFDSYRHVPLPVNRYKNGLWTFKRLVVIPVHLSGNDFLFRKLMHPLRPNMSQLYNPYSTIRWGGCKVNSSGSRFTITRNSRVTVSTTSSVTSVWSCEYNDYPIVKT